MEFISVTEFAKRQNISTQRVRKLISQNRIAGVVKLHTRCWLIPVNAVILPSQS
jgi:hypothetical protein